MSPEQLASRIYAIKDPMDQCLIAIAAFCALRVSEVFGLTWGSWQGDRLRVHSTAWHSRYFEGSTKTRPVEFRFVYLMVSETMSDVGTTFVRIHCPRP